MDDMIRLIEPMIPALRRYARGLTRNHAGADDLVQDCLERAIDRWPQRRADGDARNWVFTILHNLAINRLRQNQRRGPHIPIEDAAETVLAEAPAQEQALNRRDILEALDQLPEEQRALLLMISVEGLSYAECAAVLDVPIGTVMSRLSRGRERLREIIEREVDPSSNTVRRPTLRRVK